jgi:hypothetical protein
MAGFKSHPSCNSTGFYLIEFCALCLLVSRRFSKLSNNPTFIGAGAAGIIPSPRLMAIAHQEKCHGSKHTHNSVRFPQECLAR